MLTRSVLACNAAARRRLQEVIEIAKDKLPGYDDKIKMFYEEHIHTDEEIRYVLDGKGAPQWCVYLARAATRAAVCADRPHSSLLNYARC